MRVLLCSFSRPFVQNDGPYLTWTPQFREGLEALGCTVLEPQTVDLIEPFLRFGKGEWTSQQKIQLAEVLLDEVRSLRDRGGLDLIFCYFWDFQIDAMGMKAITELGVPTVNFFCDNTRDINSVNGLFHSFALHWVPEKSALPFYQKARVPFIHLPMGASPTRYCHQIRPEAHQVTFIGSADTLRRHLLFQIRNELPLRVAGRGWKEDGAGLSKGKNVSNCKKSIRWTGRIKSHAERLWRHGFFGEWNHFHQRYLEKKLKNSLSDLWIDASTHERMLESFWESAVTLGINRFPTPAASMSHPLVYSRLRDFEAPMAGAVYLTEWTDDLPELFDLEKEIWTWKNAVELKEKAGILLKDESMRKQMRARVREKSLATHTWRHRFQVLFRHLGLPVIR